jgi:hypothetical protein
MAPRGDRYKRGPKGHFAKGTAGRPHGAIAWKNRKIAQISRQYLDEYGDKVVAKLLTGERVPYDVRLATVKWLTDRSDGKAPQTIRHGLDPDSPEGLLLALAGQAVPGQTKADGDDEEEDHE